MVNASGKAPLEEFLKLIFVTLSVVLLIGCGGGTRGTGDTRSLSGSILTVAGQPFAGATVSQAETGATATTDADGDFTISLTVINGSATLLIVRDALETSATLDVSTAAPGDPLPPVSITIDDVAGVVVAVEVQTDPEPDPTPSPGPDDPNPTPTPESGHTIRGVAIESSGARVQDAVFSIAREDSDRTDPAGRFVLRTAKPEPRITVRVRFNGLNGAFSIEGLPADRPADVTIRVQLRTSNEVTGPGGSPPKPTLTATVDSISVR
jgi:hypothetical protein